MFDRLFQSLLSPDITDRKYFIINFVVIEQFYGSDYCN
jgi:hypothetical protein